MKWILILGMPLLLLIGPLRKTFLTTWRFMVPAFAGFVSGLILAEKLVGVGAPSLVLIIFPLVFAAAIGSSCAPWFYHQFPPRGK